MEIIAVFLPLFGAICAGFLAFVRSTDSHTPNRVDRAAQYVTCGAMILAAVAAGVVFWDVVLGQNPHTVELFTWIDSGAMEVSWAIKLDALSAVMVFMVTVVSSVIHVYSIGYMGHDSSIPRFMSYLNLFTFFMLMLVTADNLVQLFFGWEGVGLCSYLLIGFWYDRPAANAAAIKAFIVNRVGDFGFALGIFAIFMIFQTADFDTIFAAVPDKADAVMTFFRGRVSRHHRVRGAVVHRRHG